MHYNIYKQMEMFNFEAGERVRKYFKHDEWLILEEGFNPSYNRVAESAMSLGNGHMGTRGNFEEKYSGDFLKGTYYAGVYYTDKTKVGWWKNGYPEWFAKVLNGINFIGIEVIINGVELDLAKCKVKDFKRVLNMKHGILGRSFIAIDALGQETRVKAQRFLSMKRSEIGAISYSVKPLNYQGCIQMTPYLDGYVKNEDSNYDEVFWQEFSKKAEDPICHLTTKTTKLDFCVTCAMTYDVIMDDEQVICTPEKIEKNYYVAHKIEVEVPAGSEVTLIKYVAALTNRDYNNEQLVEVACHKALEAMAVGYEQLLKEHCEAWETKWHENDITIKGDVEAQQGIRFNIFHLNQTYTGEDARLNIGPKGFTGEKYGGSTYWDTEAYCIPFYLSTAPSEISRNLLIYRYNHLEKAKENAAKLGIKGALYPMVTMNGEECHNEWEITFEEIHRNGAIAYAIYNYVRYTGDQSYLSEYGFEVLMEISRFWADRVNYNPLKKCYMMLGVTGPNEYENNVNNNWYTNTIATWTLQYTIEVYRHLKKEFAEKYEVLTKKLGVKSEEFVQFQDIIDKMYYPVVEELGIFEQQDGYMDKVQQLAVDLDKKDRPINQNWSWDRILRSCLIKQADVLQGIFFFQERYDNACKKRNFDFYEPRTVHESSLSPCIHAIIASQLGYNQKAYELYVRTARLDLDNYNHDTEDGLHITSMAGTWMSIVHGFGGLRVDEGGKLTLSPFLPEAWENYSFRLVFRERILKIEVGQQVHIFLDQGEPIQLDLYGEIYDLSHTNEIKIPLKK